MNNEKNHDSSGAEFTIVYNKGRNWGVDLKHKMNIMSKGTKIREITEYKVGGKTIRTRADSIPRRGPREYGESGSSKEGRSNPNKGSREFTDPRSSDKEVRSFPNRGSRELTVPGSNDRDGGRKNEKRLDMLLQQTKL